MSATAKTRSCARCEWRSTTEPVDVSDGCSCACHVGGAFRPACDVVGGCGSIHVQELSADAQLALHALELEHPLCVVCFRSLRDDERQTCERCIDAAQSTLASIRTLYDWLPSLLRSVTAGVHSGGHQAEDGRPLPGGDALALLGPGSQGLDEDGKTTRDGDPVSVAFELHWWERHWRETRGERYDDLRPRSSAKVARDATAYLERHTRWAAVSHHGFDDYLRDLKALHARLLTATGQVRQPTKLNLDCFQCGGPLIKKIGADGLEVQTVTCRTCGTKYNPTQFAMSRAWAWVCANTWKDQDGEEWATLSALAARLDRSETTIDKTWRRFVRRVKIEHVWYFHVGDAEQQNATRPKRSRAAS